MHTRRRRCQDHRRGRESTVGQGPQVLCPVIVPWDNRDIQEKAVIRFFLDAFVLDEDEAIALRREVVAVIIEAIRDIQPHIWWIGVLGVLAHIGNHLGVIVRRVDSSVIHK